MAFLGKWLIGLITLALSVTPVAAQDSVVEHIAARGKVMYLYDRAAWLTTDDMLVRLPQARHSELGGWIVTPVLAGAHVDYFGKNTAANRVIYAADLIDGTVANARVYPAGGGPTLAPLALRMLRARQAATAELGRHSAWRPCTSAPFNTIVLPPQANGSVAVYFLTPQTVANSLPFGGHFKVEVTADDKAGESRAFTRSCINLAKPQNQKDAPVAMFLTHLMDQHPTEIHVFEQLYAGIPLVVATGPKQMWKIERGIIQNYSSRLSK